MSQTPLPLFARCAHSAWARPLAATSATAAAATDTHTRAHTTYPNTYSTYTFVVYARTRLFGVDLRRRILKRRHQRRQRRRSRRHCRLCVWEMQSISSHLANTFSGPPPAAAPEMFEYARERHARAFRLNFACVNMRAFVPFGSCVCVFCGSTAAAGAQWLGVSKMSRTPA